MLPTSVFTTTFLPLARVAVYHSRAVNIVGGHQTPAIRQNVADCIGSAAAPIKDAPCYLHVLQQVVYLVIGNRDDEMHDVSYD